MPATLSPWSSNVYRKIVKIKPICKTVRVTQINILILNSKDVSVEIPKIYKH